MRVLYINHTILKSGAAISLGTLLRHLPARVEKYFVIRSNAEIAGLLGAMPERTYRMRFMPQLMTTLYNARLPFWLFLAQLGKVPLVFLRVRQLARRWKLDLVHVNETTLLPYAFAARAAGLPVVLHARTALSAGGFELFLLRQFGKMNRARIVAIDGEVKQSFPAECREKVDVVYNPIEMGEAQSAEAVHALRASWGCGPADVVIGQVASLHEQKGIWLILEIAEQLCAAFPALRFVLVGDDSAQAGQGPELRRAIAEKGLEKCVILAGYRSDLALVYSAMDVALCLFGGYLGGVGRSAYEAAVAGKALVATLPNPEASLTLQDGVTGLLFRPDDKAGIAQALRRLAADAEFREKLGRTAREVIGGRHAPARIAAAMLAVYDELLETKK